MLWLLECMGVISEVVLVEFVVFIKVFDGLLKGVTTFVEAFSREFLEMKK